MQCPRCRQDNPSHAVFCLQCGTPLQRSGGRAQPAPSYADLQRSLTEALEQQAATTEIWRVTSGFPTDLQLMMNVVAGNAARVCGAADAVVFKLERDELRSVASYGDLPAMRSIRLDRGHVSGRAVIDRKPVHVHDILAAESEFPISAALARQAGIRTYLSAPLLHEGLPIGVIGIRRREARPFTNREVALLQSFANQAVIAIENVRLFKELQASNGELTTVLEQQTATSDILRVIGTSQTDAQPVFDAIVQSAVRLCGAMQGTVSRFDGVLIQMVAHCGMTAEEHEQSRRTFPRPLSDPGGTATAIRTASVCLITDLDAEEEKTSAAARSMLRARRIRSVLVVPMLWQGKAIGSINLVHQKVGAFTAAHVELLQTFADQAVIAIENVRLFTELQASNKDLREALDQQTATSEVLKVISRSTFQLEPVLDTLIENATRLTGAQQGFIFRPDGEVYQLAVDYNAPPAFREWVQRHPIRPGDGSVVGQVAQENRVVQILDAQANQAWRAHHVDASSIGDVRTLLGVPMFREGALVGVITMWRSEIQPFTDRQIELVTTFADQAVIAIENVRLFKELEARTRELTHSVEELRALGEVSQAVSSTLELETVLATIVSRAVQMSGSYEGIVYEFDEATQTFHARAWHQITAEHLEALRRTPVRLGEGAVGHAGVIREPVQVADIEAEWQLVAPQVRTLHAREGMRSLLAIPLVREDRLFGGLVILRRERGAFPPEVIATLQTLAAQSVLAIQNARLFRELADKSRELEVASQHKSEFLANMSHELRTPLNAIIGFSEVLTDRMFGELNEKQDEYLRDIYTSGTHLLSLINDILDLSKIEAGRMELELTDFDLPTALENALVLVHERAQRRNLTLRQDVDAGLGQIQGDERKIRQVVLNLLSNAIKFTSEGGRIDVAAAPKDGCVEVSVSDTGVGIAPEDQDAVFEEFRQVGTADKKAEGTGLGLTLCRKFIELHGGKIWVKSQVGAGSTFTFTIPVHRGG